MRIEPKQFQNSKMSEAEQKLHIAVRSDKQDDVENLLNSGVSINCLFYGWTPFQLSIENGIVLFSFCTLTIKNSLTT